MAKPGAKVAGFLGCVLLAIYPSIGLVGIGDLDDAPIEWAPVIAVAFGLVVALYAGLDIGRRRAEEALAKGDSERP